MGFKTALFLLSIFSTVFSATEICISQTPCKCIKAGGEVIDLTSLGSQTFPKFYEVQVNNSFEFGLYSYNPCYAFTSPDNFLNAGPGNKHCNKAAACVRKPSNGDGELPEEHVIGYQETAKFGSSADKNLGLHINYTVDGANQNLTVKLICTENDSSNHLVIEQPETEENKNIVMTLYSKCACINGCVTAPPKEETSGLSTGSKLLIAFFTILLAYFIVGIIWNFFNGSRGLELVPNYDFWNDLPKLIIEGVAFSCFCFSRKSNYGEV